MKKKSSIIAIVMVVAMSAIFASNTSLQAGQFDDEAWWTNYCSEYIDINDTKKKADCLAYQQYLRNKKSDAASQSSDIQSTLKSISDDAAKLANLSKELQAQIDQLAINIDAKVAAIQEIEASIVVVEANIQEREVKILERKDFIKERMLKLQIKMNTNEYINFMMGATDLVDMIRRAKSVQTYTDYDNALIDQLNEEMIQLESEKQEKSRLEATLIAEKDAIEADKAMTETKKIENDAVVAEYQKQEAELMAKKMAFDSIASAADANMPSLRYSGGDVPNVNSAGFITNIVPGGRRGNGTWNYSGGGVHLGIDIAAPVRTPIYAPADSIVLYANNPVGTNSGFLGNWTGYPIGGGNTVLLLMSVNGQTYAMQFAHLAQEGMNALTQPTIKQGEVFALLGNSGNSSGPHTHIEVYRLNISVQEAVQVWNTKRDFSFGTGWGSAGVNGTSQYGQRIRPETIFGY